MALNKTAVKLPQSNPKIQPHSESPSNSLTLPHESKGNFSPENQAQQNWGYGAPAQIHPWTPDNPLEPSPLVGAQFIARFLSTIAR